MPKKKKTEQKELFGSGTVEQRKIGEKMFDQLAEAFFRPVIGHQAWASIITKEQKGRITIERLKQISRLKGKKIERATDYEALIYLHTASLATPLGHHWSKIFFYLFKKFYPDKSDFISEYEAEIDEYCRQELEGLKRWIFRRQKK